MKKIMPVCLGVMLMVYSAMALSDANFIDEDDAKVMWPINEKTQKIPKFKDPRSGWILGGDEQQINEANDKYGPEDRQTVIDECRMEAFRKSTQLVDKQGVIKRLKDKNDGLIIELQRNFMYCTQAMLNQWAADEAQEEKDSHR